MNMTKRCAVNNNTNNIPQTKDGQQSIRKASANPTLRTKNIDSIISSIDIELNIDKNGTLEATIDSPTRKIDV
jgi:hypothetical protein